MVDPNDAPKGYIAVPHVKPVGWDIPTGNVNACSNCELWCTKLCFSAKCLSKDRQDKETVMFKLIK